MVVLNEYIVRITSNEKEWDMKIKAATEDGALRLATRKIKWLEGLKLSIVRRSG